MCHPSEVLRQVRGLMKAALLVRKIDGCPGSIGTQNFTEATMTSSQTYLIGFIILILGIAAAAFMLSVPTVWIAVGAVGLIGIGIMAAASRSRSGGV
jgi:hypothetical protein